MAPIATLAVKLQAQIAEFQGEFREAQRDVQKFHDNFEATATKASAFGNLIARGVEIGVSAFLDLGKKALESASKIEDMASKTGLSIRTIQEFQHVADQTGTSLEAFSGAAFLLGTRLAGDNKSVKAAVEALGLEFETLRSLRPEEQFDLIAEALGRMESPQERNRIGLELFGRRFQEIAPAIAEGYRKLADGADKMADETVKRLAAAEDAWSKLGRKAVIVSGEVIAASIEIIDRATTRWSNFFKIIASGPAAGFVNLDLPNRATEGLTPKQLAFDEAFNAKVEEQREERLKKFRESLAAVGEQSSKTRTKLAELRTETENFDGAIRDAIKEVKDVERAVFEAGQEYERTAIVIDHAAVAQSYFDRVNGAMRPNLQAVKVDLDAIAESYRQLGTRAEEAAQAPSPVSEFLQGFGDIDIKREAQGFAQNIVGSLAGAIRTGDWSEFEDHLRNSVSEFAGSAIAAGVNSLVPGLGTLLQPLFSAFTDKFLGFIGLGSNQTKKAREAFAESLGFSDTSALWAELRATLPANLAESLIDRALGQIGKTDTKANEQWMQDVRDAMEEFGTLADQAAERITAIGLAIEGVNAKAELFAAPFQALIDAREKVGDDPLQIEKLNAKLAAMGEKGQAEFERIGLFAAAAFAGIVRETGDAIGALDRLSPALTVLKDGVEKFGLTSTGTIDTLIGLFDLVHDQTTGPILQAIQATGQIFAGLQDAGLLTADLFQTVSDDIGAAFRDLEAKGGDVAKAMALSQPVLQRLWEAQQIYGEVTDETTRKILQQAEDQGLVGDHMKDVNQRILDVLIAIADVFGAKIPDSMRATRQAATDTASRIEDEFSRIKIPTIYVPVDFEYPDGAPQHDRVPFLASGGIVRKRTLAVLGESGPEAVVPLSQLGSVAPEAGSTTIVIQDAGRTFAEIVVPHIPGIARRYVTV